jgi:ArsR family transcriptional regulator
VSVPLYQAKADFLRMLGPLQDGPLPARELLTTIEVEPSGLSQQPTVLCRSGIVTSTREAPTRWNGLPAELRGTEVVAR